MSSQKHTVKLGLLVTLLIAPLVVGVILLAIEYGLFQRARSATPESTPTPIQATEETPLPRPLNTPYQDAFIELIFAVPELQTTLEATNDIPYNYRIRYYIPEFDWESSGYKPHIQLVRIVDYDDGMQIATLNDILPSVGKTETFDIHDRFIVPSDRDIWKLRLQIEFVNTQTGTGFISGNQVINLEYPITELP